MKDEIFIDSNILIYAVSQNSPKCDVARQLLMENVEQITVSSQVINEFISICIWREWKVKEMAKLMLSTNFTKNNNPRIASQYFRPSWIRGRRITHPFLPSTYTDFHLMECKKWIMNVKWKTQPLHRFTNRICSYKLYNTILVRRLLNDLPACGQVP